MRWLALLFLLGACDTIFRIDPVPEPRDAAIDGVTDGATDAMPDADLTRTPGCPTTYFVIAGESTQYRWVTAAANWQMAQTMCETDRGNFQKYTHLVVFDDDFERSRINATMSGQSFWIGLADIATEGALEWVSTENPVYPPLSAFQNGTIDTTSGADCGLMLGNSDLQMFGCGNAFKYICECDDYPVDPSHF